MNNLKSIFSGLVGRTALQYLFAAIGGALVAKGWITADLWEMASDGLTEGLLVALGGGGLIAVLTAAFNGIREAGKDKAVVNGEKIVLSSRAQKEAVLKAATTGTAPNRVGLAD